MKEEIKVNDGKGLFDSVGLIDTLIVDCNTLVKNIFSGNCVAFCAKVVEIVQKLNNLKTGVSSEMESMQKNIDDLKRFIDDVNNARGDD